jgi:hypothetical protein
VAIHLPPVAMDCFAPRAMTIIVGGNRRLLIEQHAEPRTKKKGPAFPPTPFLIAW